MLEKGRVCGLFYFNAFMSGEERCITIGMVNVIVSSFAKDGPKKCSGLDIVQYDTASMTESKRSILRLRSRSS